MRWLLILLAACSSSTPHVPLDDSAETETKYGNGMTAYQVTDPSTSRVLQVEAFYPLASFSDVFYPAVDITTFDPVHQATYQGLLAAAPSCPSRGLTTMVDAPHMVPGPFPVVMVSHCHACTRLSNASTAIRLASNGFVVISVEHAGDNLWEELDGVDASIDSAELEIRAQDIRAVMDQLGTSPVADIIDQTKIGVLGHSMGAVTAGRVAQLDSRISAAAALCAPMDNPLTPGVTLADLKVPLMFMVAQEDNSITELGNKFIRDNYTNAPVPATKIEVADAGHWSVSDLAGLTTGFAPGCGDGVRQTDGTNFTYLDPIQGRDVAASYTTAFFQATLLGNDGAEEYLERASPSFNVTVDHHE
ncbi:MAG: dienelactone hydrolase family protein [Kofleriaceae bacterium]